MTSENDTQIQNEPPRVLEPLDGSAPGVFFIVRGTGTPGNTAVCYSTKDPMNPIFGQSISDTGQWQNHIDLHKFGFYMVEKTKDGTVVSPRSEVVNINLE
ncbi:MULTISPECIES: hypothetical protein [Pseudomonas]|uniref:hypothetical protein n=1 Tax=Pseudomonas TaxID=286 RepID=UPI00111BF9FA|nr:MULTISPECIES: hypothetical protein [Pseudomonas]NKF28570.1 hypothetical protein [Pseudomonas sp. BG5]